MELSGENLKVGNYSIPAVTNQKVKGETFREAELLVMSELGWYVNYPCVNDFTHKYTTIAFSKEDNFIAKVTQSFHLPIRDKFQRASEKAVFRQVCTLRLRLSVLHFS